MATDKQIEANRLNALKSTGPRTPEGKSAAARNAFKHGIFAEASVIIGEDHTAFEALRDDYLDRFHPAGPDEEALVANLINYSWLLARFRRIETRTWDMRLADPISNHPLVTAHILGFRDLEFLQRRINCTNRQFHRDIELLLKLQAARKRGPDEPVKLGHQAIAYTINDTINDTVGAAGTPGPVPQPKSSETTDLSAGTGAVAATGVLPSLAVEIGFVPAFLNKPTKSPAESPANLPLTSCHKPDRCIVMSDGPLYARH